MNLARRIIRTDLRGRRGTYPAGTTDEKGKLLNRHERRALSASAWREHWRSVGRVFLHCERHCAYLNRRKLCGGPYLAPATVEKRRL